MTATITAKTPHKNNKKTHKVKMALARQEEWVEQGDRLKCLAKQSPETEILVCPSPLDHYSEQSY